MRHVASPPTVAPSTSQDRSGVGEYPVQAIVIVALGCGGLLRAVSRYALSFAIPTDTGRFPWGTVLINLSGLVNDSGSSSSS